MYYHDQLLPAAISTPIFTAAISALSLQQDAPLTATLHYVRDFLSYGTDHPNSSSFSSSEAAAQSEANQPANIAAVKAVVSAQGEALVQRVLTGMMFTYPRDCLNDASGVLLALFDIAPEPMALWIKGTITMLPEGSVKAGEGERLVAAVAERVKSGETRKIRSLLQDFTVSYRRRNVAPRDGLGRLEATRFRFSG